MSTNYPLTLDTYTYKVDGVDDVMAAHVNNLQDAIEALEATSQSQSLLKVTNSSGSTVAANDIGYIDEAGEFKLVSTAYFVAAWCVVIVGGIDAADIIVAPRGRCTIVLNGNCSAGDFLYTSSTAKQAQPLSYLRPEVFAVAQSANAGGAGGTCDAVLLTRRATHQLTGTQKLLYIDAGSTTDWVGVQNGVPVGQIITYTAPISSGSEDAIVPQSTLELGKLVLNNTTKGEEAYIEAVNTGANDIQITDAADTVGWENGDALSVRSQTNTHNRGAARYFDVFLASTEIPALAVGMHVNWLVRDTGGIQDFYIHPWQTRVETKDYLQAGQVANVNLYGFAPIPIINRRYTFSHVASGAGTARTQQRVFEVILATP